MPMLVSLSTFTRLKLRVHCKNLRIHIQNEETYQNIASKIFPQKKSAFIFFTILTGHRMRTLIQTSPIKIRNNTPWFSETICKNQFLLVGVKCLNWRFLFVRPDPNLKFLVTDYPVPMYVQAYY